MAKEVSLSDLDTLPSSDIYLLGELHDQAAHHRAQARAIRSIQPKAMVFEMLTPEQAAAGNSADRSDRDALERALQWSDTSWPSFDMYYPLFQAAPDARIYGAALPRDDVRHAMSVGAAEVFGAGAERFGLTEALDPDEQSEREELQAIAHCDALPVHMLPGMVEAQRLRDAHFSRAALEALEDVGKPVVVITGNGHARTDWGMPVYLYRASPDVDVLSLGQVPKGEDNAAFDLWLGQEVQSPDVDPCDAFKSN